MVVSMSNLDIPIFMKNALQNQIKLIIENQY